jgi:hypothetical protein
VSQPANLRRRHEDLRCWWLVSKQARYLIVFMVTPPAFDDDLGLAQGIEDPIEQLIVHVIPPGPLRGADQLLWTRFIPINPLPGTDAGCYASGDKRFKPFWDAHDTENRSIGS